MIFTPIYTFSLSQYLFFIVPAAFYSIVFTIISGPRVQPQAGRLVPSSLTLFSILIEVVIMNKMNHATTEYYGYITRGTFLCMRRAIRESPMLEIVPDNSQRTINVIKVLPSFPLLVTINLVILLVLYDVILFFLLFT